MQMRLRFAAVSLAAAITTVGMGMLAPAAHAAGTGDTIATFTITGGALNITVPASTVNLNNSVTAGSLTASGQLGDTSVSDQRAALNAVWTVTVTSTDFITGAGGANQVVTKANVFYASGNATSSTGTGAFVPTSFTPPAPGLPLATSAVGAAWAGAPVGVNTAHWNPTLSFVLSSSQVAGTYSGTITQAVA